MIWESHSWSHIQKRQKLFIEMFTAALFTKPRHGSNLNVHHQRNGQRRCGIHTKWNITIQKSKVVPFATTWMSLDIILLNEVKSDTERQILYDITYLWNLKQ